MQGKDVVFIAAGIAIGFAISAAAFNIPDGLVTGTASVTGPVEPPASSNEVMIKEIIARQEQFLQECRALDMDDPDGIDEYFADALDFEDDAFVKISGVEESGDPAVLPYLAQIAETQDRIDSCQGSKLGEIRAGISGLLGEELASGRVRPGDADPAAFYEGRIAYLSEVGSETMERCASLDIPGVPADGSDPADLNHIVRNVGFGNVIRILQLGEDAVAVHREAAFLAEDAGAMFFDDRLYPQFAGLEDVVDETGLCAMEKFTVLADAVGYEWGFEPESGLESGVRAGLAAGHITRINEIGALQQDRIDQCVALDPENLSDVGEYFADYLENSPVDVVEMIAILADAESDGSIGMIMSDFYKHDEAAGVLQKCVDAKTDAAKQIHGQDAIRNYIRDYRLAPLSGPERGDRGVDGSGPAVAGFRDRTGYTPGWTAGMQESQIVSVCGSMSVDDYDSRDFDWCGEFSGHIRDRMSAGREQRVFRDVTEYAPYWAAGKGEGQILGICGNLNASNSDSRNLDWCGEYSGYVQDRLNPTERKYVFRDAMGYGPSWAVGKGDNQILAICGNMGDEEYGSQDFNWCRVFSDHVLKDIDY